MPIKMLLATSAAALLLAGCAAVDLAADRAKLAAAYYCQAGESERLALRERVSTERGPVIQVNCENLAP